MSAHDPPSSSHLDLVAREINGIPMEQIPWYEDVRRVARLLRWLVLMDEVPASVPDFIESGESWRKQYEEMCLFEGSAASLREGPGT